MKKFGSKHSLHEMFREGGGMKKYGSKHSLHEMEKYDVNHHHHHHHHHSKVMMILHNSNKRYQLITHRVQKCFLNQLKNPLIL